MSKKYIYLNNLNNPKDLEKIYELLVKLKTKFFNKKNHLKVKSYNDLNINLSSLENKFKEIKSNKNKIKKIITDLEVKELLVNVISILNYK